MGPKLLLRIASFLMLLHTVGHSFGALTWKNNTDPAVKMVISGMQDHSFEFMGRSSTLAAFYQGFGIIMIFALLMVTIWLWLLSGELSNPFVLKMLPILALFLLAMAVAEYYYFFAFAAGISFISALLTLLALFRLRKKNSL